ncbi:alpha-tocopherol transfer protein-like isoform X2 [Nasonia vitripennis]|nr:alpha-tocopherol transfer protein-like isoform X2 [Nasonia vitripennis]
MVPLAKEMKKNPELKEADIQSLRDWCQKQPHLPQMTDSELALFLHSNYYRLEPTKNTIDTFYTVRTHVPEFFSNRDPVNAKDLLQMFKVVMNMPLERTTKDGYDVIYGALSDFEPSNYDYTFNMKLFGMVMDLWLYGKGTMKGHVILVDLKGLVIGHVARFSPMALKRFLYYLQEGLPVRLKGFHFVNTNPVMDILMNIMRPFMKKELLDILHLHQSVNAIEEFNIPVDILPNESGGKAGPAKELFAAEVKKLEAHREWFIQEEKTQRIDESKRPGKAKSATDLFGVEGSFKKLEID